ncbi:hypothetical protein HU200_064989 [Digitaria exilis]|uniref:Acyl-ACP-thioesterase N-terminal domain-containing protein n=1 Tax=Digitaria exilis TaxID=1010633 RepID=A0A835AAJ2_9POAL|nr:hypothetical protein HU200_064989 [Digitaria exilis]
MLDIGLALATPTGSVCFLLQPSRAEASFAAGSPLDFQVLKAEKDRSTASPPAPTTRPRHRSAQSTPPHPPEASSPPPLSSTAIGANGRVVKLTERASTPPPPSSTAAAAAEGAGDSPIQRKCRDSWGESREFRILLRCACWISSSGDLAALFSPLLLTFFHPSFIPSPFLPRELREFVVVLSILPHGRSIAATAFFPGSPAPAPAAPKNGLAERPESLDPGSSSNAVRAGKTRAHAAVPKVNGGARPYHPRCQGRSYNQLPDWSMLLAAITTIFLAAEKQWTLLDWKPRRP